jgi:hypothetical protein
MQRDINALSAQALAQAHGDDRIDSWQCVSCGDDNYAKRMDCRKCKKPRPAGEQPQTPVGWLVRWVGGRQTKSPIGFLLGMQGSPGRAPPRA